MRNIKIFTFLRGYVTFEGIGGFEEEFLSKLIDENIKIWDTKYENSIITGKVSATKYRTLARCAKRSGVKLKHKNKKGALFLALKHRNRIGILMGIALFLIFVLVMSQFVWKIEVVGDENINIPRVLQAAQDNGIKTGVWGKSLKLRELEQKISLSNEEISWIGINLNGSKLTIDVRKKIDTPEMVSIDNPCNIVAACDGYIVDARTYIGHQTTWEGMGVKKGDILVTGAISIENVKEEQYVHAKAEMIAECPETKYFKVPLTQTIYEESGKTVKRKFLKVFSLNCPLFFAKEINGPFTADEKVSMLKIGKNQLPFGVSTHEYTLLNAQEVNYSEEEAKALAQEQMNNYETNILKDAKIISKEVNSYIENGKYIIKSDYIIKKDIAKEQIIYINH